MKENFLDNLGLGIIVPNNMTLVKKAGGLKSKVMRTKNWLGKEKVILETQLLEEPNNTLYNGFHESYVCMLTGNMTTLMEFINLYFKAFNEYTHDNLKIFDKNQRDAIKLNQGILEVGRELMYPIAKYAVCSALQRKGFEDDAADLARIIVVPSKFQLNYR